MTAPPGLLLVNLGSPAAPTKQAVREYLGEFLWDKRVVNIPRLIWWPILHGFILTTRPARSARLYASVWTSEGAPLIATSKHLKNALQTKLDKKSHVELGMRYGKPSILSALKKLQDKGCDRILIFPLYPQYSATTTESAFDAVAASIRGFANKPGTRFIRSYHDHPFYIKALAKSVRRLWDKEGKPDKLLMSFHGIPKRYAEAGDPYPDECRATARLLADELKLSRNEWFLSFQSRFGREEWLRPYTDETLGRWGKEGLKSADVICPGFAADCLETLEEVAIELRDTFIQAGGDHFRYIPALNDHPDHIRALAEIADHSFENWQTSCNGTSTRDD